MESDTPTLAAADLAQIRERISAATPPERVRIAEMPYGVDLFRAAGDDPEDQHAWYEIFEEARPEDVVFAYHAWRGLPRLLAEVERLRARVAAAEG